MFTFEITSNSSYLFGTIRLSDGRAVREVVTKRQAFEAAATILNVQISRKEWLGLRQQIYSSPLPDKDDKLEASLKRDLEFLEKAFELLQRIIDGRIEELAR
jgi:hypothetical protein